MTGRELIRLQATLQGLPTAEGRRRADDLLERVDLTGAADRRIGGYSGGMKRRLDLAAALVHEPRVLFLDEPTTGLDPVSRKTIWEEVRALNDEGTTVFLTTQYLEEADQLADNVGIIDQGRIVAEGTPDALKAEIGNPHVQLQLADGSIDAAERACAEIGRLLPPTDGRTVLVEVENGAAALPQWRANLATIAALMARAKNELLRVPRAAIFTTTAYAPLALLQPWMRSVAEVNPVTQVVDAARQGFVGAVTWAETWPAIAVMLALTAVLGAWALREMRRTAA